MAERSLSNPTTASGHSPWQQLTSSPLPSRQLSFVGMPRPPLLKSPSMRRPEASLSTETIRPNRRKVLLEVEIPNPSSSLEDHNRPIVTRSNSIKTTLDTVLRSRKNNQDPTYGLPELSCGESSQSEESAPSTPWTALSNTSYPVLRLDPQEEERKDREWQAFVERQATLRDRSQFEFRRQFIPHHPFEKEEVPYMQCYSHVALHNDYYLYDLLHYLTPPGSPTFHDFGNKPPRDALDLGCGEGYWAAEAATIWKSAGTCVTAFDIVDLGRSLRRSLDPEILRRVIWVKGNFLQQVLPFPPKSFDLVRMANLTLTIPQDRWVHLLEEVKRILRPGGVLEIIDDELFFPDIRPSPAATLIRSCSLKERRKPTLHISETKGKGIWKPLPPLPPSLPRGISNYKQNFRLGPLAEFEMKSTTTRTMETIFQNMLRKKYDISPAPHKILEPTLAQVFGSFDTETRRLAVPTKDLLAKKYGPDDNGLPERGSRVRRGRHSLDNAVSDFTTPVHIAPKAMQLLHPQVESRPRRPYQPTGFVVLPSTFVLCEPEVLEMHACHNMHIVLACKDALARFVQECKDAAGMPLITEDEFEELVFEYDSFKRQRMNWPQDYPGVKHEEELFSPSSPKSMFSLADLTSRFRTQPAGTSLNVPISEDDSMPIRRIRAYIARRP